MRTNADLRMNEENATRNAATPGFYYLRLNARGSQAAVFYPVKAMRVEPILCASLLMQAASGQTVHQPAADADSLVRDGAAAQQHGDLKTAIDDFRKALALNPEMIQARASLGEALAAAGQMNEAIENDARVLEVDPQNDEVRMNLAMAYYRTGDWNHARLQLEKLHAARPADINRTTLLAYTYNKLDRPGDAVALLRPLERDQAGSFQFEYVYAFALIASGNLDEGLPRMEKLAKENNSAEAWLAAGSGRFYRKEMEMAQADLDAAIALNPKLPGVQSLDGQARYGHGDVEGAVVAFHAALREDPKDFMANLYLGTIRLEQRNLDEAQPLLELALQLRPNWPFARLQMAKLNELKGRLQEAEDILEDLERSDPNWIEPHVALAAIYYRLKRPADGAREREIVQRLEAERQRRDAKRH
jgi:tetratricopeptide (TPR) repeat protein